METSQKQREAMLREARMYQTRNDIPAIHPRYRSSYNRLYTEDNERKKSSLGIRILICLILFALFAAIDQGQITETPVSSTQIIFEIEKSMEF